MEEPIEVKFIIEDVINVFLDHLKETTDCVTHIYYSIEASDIDIKKPLPSDSFPITVNNRKTPKTINEQKISSFDWAIRKAFEDFINGLTKSLKEANKLLRTILLSQRSKFSMTK